MTGEPVSRASKRGIAQRAKTSLLSDQESASGPRQRLLDATVNVLARRGYTQSTVKDVLSQAGCSRSTFYAQFSDMEDCLVAVLSVLTDELLERVQQAVDDAPAPHAPRAAACALLDFAREHERPALVLFCESLAGGARAMDLRDGLIDKIAGLVASRLQSRSNDTTVFDLPAGAVIGTVFRLLAHRLRRGASGLHELNDGVLAWLDTYETADPHRHSHDFLALGEQDVLPRISLTPAAPPPPVRLGRHGANASDRSRNQRERILFACAQCCYERGYAQIGITDIVSHASLSRSVFYEHFPDRQSAALAMLEQAFELMMTDSVRAYFAQDSWPDRVWAAARALCEGYATHPALFSRCFIDYAAIGPSGVQLAHDRLLAFTLLLEDGYRQRPEAQRLPRVVSEVMVSLLVEHPYREIRRGKPPDRFYDILPVQVYAGLTPFIGPARAAEVVHAKVAELKREA